MPTNYHIEPNGVYELPQALGTSSLILLAEDEQVLVECHSTNFGDVAFQARANNEDDWLEYEVQPDGTLGLVILGDTSESDTIDETDWTIADLKLMGYMRNGTVVQTPPIPPRANVTKNQALGKAKNSSQSSKRSVNNDTEYDYLVVPFIGHVKVGVYSAGSAQEVSSQLQEVINQHVEQGWQFYRIEKVGIQGNPGCLASLLGARTTVTNLDQIIFRRPPR